MAEAFKQICVDRFLSELVADDDYQQQQRRQKRSKFTSVNTKEFEDRLEEIVVQAFSSVVKPLAEADTAEEQERQKALKMMQGVSADAFAKGGDFGSKDVTQLATSEKLHQTREKMVFLKRSSLAFYQVRLRTTKQHQEETNMLAEMEAQKWKAQEILRKQKQQEEGQNEESHHSD